MPSFDFIGPSYAARSIIAESEDLLNLYPELIESGDGASRGAKYTYYGTPGKVLEVNLPAGVGSCIVSAQSLTGLPIRGLPHNFLFFAIAGGVLYGVYSDVPGVNGQTAIATLDQQIDPLTGAALPTQILVITPSQLFCVANGGAWVVEYGTPIATTALNQGGGGYAVNDTGTIAVGSQDATYIVTGVDANGAVTGFTITFVGAAYTVSSNNPTLAAGAQPGTGSGFTIDVLTVAAAQWTSERQIIAGIIATDNFISSATFLDQFVIVSLAANEQEPQRRQFYNSAVGNIRSWDLLSFNTKEGASDPNQAVYASQQLLMVLGTQTTELWQVTGALLDPFQRLPAAGIIQTGLAATNAIGEMDGSIVWIGIDQRGGLVAWQLRGVTPVRISNHAIENAWRNYDPFGASLYTYQDDGHFFVVVHFPRPDQTWVYDSTVRMWHRRAFYDGQNYHADLARYHAFVSSAGHWVLDYRNGNVYRMDIDVYVDDTAPIVRQRTAPHLNTEQVPNFYSKFRLQVQQGTVPAGITPSYLLEISDDGGRTFYSAGSKSGGRIGNYRAILDWFGLGTSRDRVFRVTNTDPIEQAWIDAYLEVVPGRRAY